MFYKYVFIPHQGDFVKCKMAWCAAVLCESIKRKNPDKTFFKLPSEEKCRAAWLAAINRENAPKQVFLCSDHFKESCFDTSWDLRSKLLNKSGPIQRKLIAGSIPTIFPHKKKTKERTTTIQRELKKK